MEWYIQIPKLFLPTLLTFIRTFWTVLIFCKINPQCYCDYSKQKPGTFHCFECQLTKKLYTMFSMHIIELLFLFQISIFLALALCTLSAAEEPTAPIHTDLEVKDDNPKQPTLLAIIVPSIDPLESANDLPEEEEDIEEYDGDDDDDFEVENEDGEIMKTARNIVFRPLFTYRQKKTAKRRVQVRRNAARKSSSRRNAQKRNAQPVNRYYSYNRNYYRPRYPSYYPSYYYNAQFPTIAQFTQNLSQHLIKLASMYLCFILLLFIINLFHYLCNNPFAYNKYIIKSQDNLY